MVTQSEWIVVLKWALWMFVGLKLAATVVQLRMMRGNYREMPKTVFFRTVYVTGKTTPVLACVCAFVSAVLMHRVAASWLLGCLTVYAAVLSLTVVRLRQQGKFFGLLDVFQSRAR